MITTLETTFTVSKTMKNHLTEIRVRYSETDQMGFVYYGAYASYFEVARVELLRAAGINYKDLELSGILMPVSHYEIRYNKPARYDDLLKIHTAIESLTTARVKFVYNIQVDDSIMCEATTTLAFVAAHTLRPTRCPQHLVELLSPASNS